MRQLSFNALKLMDGQSVMVHDLEYDAFDQPCIVRVCYKNVVVNKKFKTQMVIEKIQLYNEEFLFEYDFLGRCVNGEFTVYSN